jgi:hypothetical protein
VRTRGLDVTRAGEYADLAALTSSPDLLDTTSARSKLLAQRIVEISEQHLGDAPDLSAPPPVTGDGSASELELRTFSCDARGDGYVKLRVRKQCDVWSAAGQRAERQLIALKAVSYLVGASGTVCSPSSV